MQHSKYLIIGSSHAALQAIAAIRGRDAAGSITVLTRDSRLPYSPTILPYIVSGRKQPEQIVLRDEAYFTRNGVELVRNAKVTAVEPSTKRVRTDSGGAWSYEKLLLATGANPSIPPIPGLADVPFHVLRTMDDAIGLREAMRTAKSAIVLGAGLCAMHAVDNMTKAGIAVTVVEICSRVLREYVSPRAGEMIARVFASEGVCIRTGCSAAAVANDGGRRVMTLDNGETLTADLLMIGAGVTPATDYLAGSGVELDRGITVDDRMRTNIAAIWAAGDVAQTRGFWGGTVVNGILPGAAEQGRLAGLDMADPDVAKSYAGALSVNTYHFFDHHLVSVGFGGELPQDAGFEVSEEVDDDNGVYHRVVFSDGRLAGISTINDFFDAGIMRRVIQDRLDLSSVKAEFLARPQHAGRLLMSRNWR